MRKETELFKGRPFSMQIVCMLICCLLWSNISLAQEKHEVTGTVINSLNEFVPFLTILKKGTSEGTSTAGQTHENFNGSLKYL